MYAQARMYRVVLVYGNHLGLRYAALICSLQSAVDCSNCYETGTALLAGPWLLLKLRTTSSQGKCTGGSASAQAASDMYKQPTKCSSSSSKLQEQRPDLLLVLLQLKAGISWVAGQPSHQAAIRVPS